MAEFPDCPFGTTITSGQILEALNSKTTWEDRYRQLILWGKALPDMPEALRLENVTVKGCESQVWIVSREEQGHWYFCADSDARIVKGLIAVVLAAVNNRTADEIRSFNMEAYFSDLKLFEHLSPSRGNGLKAIVDKIYQDIK
ncbi:cysteine desulfurase sulfur acceptor subunit CsdE [Vibrio salinus]|uniref:cysteine desulfurase sulfur acceptor subunit CsdE n=1 Tax=Vibrio salinus TaxID=2899784 RepID=UPI001E34D3BD|nr:cysteine desulfurase sulfur acceptor subunit CsdE [Vibrio salinus]MCE0494341.1 cysteine desulfurase sulfur acceptor subunit CsdE [Vibrio salinus]